MESNTAKSRKQQITKIINRLAIFKILVETNLWSRLLTTNVCIKQSLCH